MELNRSEKWLAGLLTAALLGAVGVRLWAHDAALEIPVPRYLAADPEGVYLEFADTIYRLHAAGTVLAQWPLAGLGVEDWPAGLQALGDGRFAIGDLEGRRVLACEDGDCRPLGPADPVSLRGTFKFALDPAAGLLYLTDTARHRVLRHDVGGGATRQLSGAGQLRYPNGIALHDGLIWIADTNHHRLAGLRADGDGTELVREISLKTALGRPDRIWPIAFARDPAGRWWVINADERLGDADLLVLDPDGAPLARVALPGGADPTDLAYLGGRMLVADRALVRLHAVDTGSLVVGDFAVPGLGLGAAGARRARYLDLQLAALVALGVAVLGMVPLITRAAGRQFTALPAASGTGRVADSGQIRWITPAADTARKLRQLSWVFPVLALVAVAASGVAVHELLDGTGTLPMQALLRLAVLCGGLLLAGVVSFLLMRRSLAARVGTDGQLLYLAPRPGEVRAVRPEEVVYSRRRLAWRRLSVALEAGQLGPLFEPAEFYQQLGPLLERARRVDDASLWLYQLRQGQPLAIGVLLLIVALLGLAMLPGFRAAG